MKKMGLSILASAALFWGGSIIATPVASTALGAGELSRILAAYGVESGNYQQTGAQATNVRGTITRFLEGSELVIDDGNGRINVVYEEKWKPLNLSVGERVSVTGDMTGSGDAREILAEEILAPRGQVYPQPERFNRVYNSDFRHQVSMSQNSSSMMSVSEILLKASEGDMVTLEGTVMEMPGESMMVFGDTSGMILVDIDDASDTLNLSRGDMLVLTGKVFPGANGKKELQAMSIEKKETSKY